MWRDAPLVSFEWLSTDTSNIIMTMMTTMIRERCPLFLFFFLCWWLARFVRLLWGGDLLWSILTTKKKRDLPRNCPFFQFYMWANGAPHVFIIIIIMIIIKHQKKRFKPSILFLKYLLHFDSFKHVHKNCGWSELPKKYILIWACTFVKHFFYSLGRPSVNILFRDRCEPFFL